MLKICHSLYRFGIYSNLANIACLGHAYTSICNLSQKCLDIRKPNTDWSLVLSSIIIVMINTRHYIFE